VSADAVCTGPIVILLGPLDSAHARDGDGVRGSLARRKLEDQTAVRILDDDWIAVHPLLVARAIEGVRLVSDRGLAFAAGSPHFSPDVIVRLLSIQVPNDVSHCLH
jgi:hypothetical protein